jgi:hypothetical protein
VLVSAWVEKERNRLVDELSPVDVVPSVHVCDTCAGRSEISRMVCEIRELRRVGWLKVPDEGVDLLVSVDEWIALEEPEDQVPGPEQSGLVPT